MSTKIRFTSQTIVRFKTIKFELKSYQTAPNPIKNFHFVTLSQLITGSRPIVSPDLTPQKSTPKTHRALRLTHVR